MRRRLRCFRRGAAVPPGWRSPVLRLRAPAGTSGPAPDRPAPSLPRFHREPPDFPARPDSSSPRRRCAGYAPGGFPDAARAGAFRAFGAVSGSPGSGWPRSSRPGSPKTGRRSNPVPALSGGSPLPGPPFRHAIHGWPPAGRPGPRSRRSNARNVHTIRPPRCVPHFGCGRFRRARNRLPSPDICESAPEPASPPHRDSATTGSRSRAAAAPGAPVFAAPAGAAEAVRGPAPPG